MWGSIVETLNPVEALRRAREEKARRDREWLHGDDISVCPRCGAYEHIWHIWNGDEVVGTTCSRCLWHCGTATIWDALFHLLLEAGLALERFGRRHGWKRITKWVQRMLREG